MVKHWAALALLVTGTAAGAQQPVGSPSGMLLPGETLLEVEAHGTVKAVPDEATLSTSASADGDSAEVARAKAAAIVQRMIAAARAAGVPDGAMRTEALRVAPRFKPDKDGDDTDAIIGYRAQTRLKIRLRSVALVAPVFDALSSAGATEIEGPQFDFGDDAPLKTRARAAAVAAAQAQATDYGTAFGLHVARILRISERRAGSDGGQDIIVTGSRRQPSTPPVMPGEQDITADVWIDYALIR